MTSHDDSELITSVPREQKRALGRGLSALIPSSKSSAATTASDDSDSASSNSLLQLPLLNIALNPYQPREAFNAELLAELTESVRQHGVLQPIVVRPKGKNTYELVAGERRFRAATAAGLKEIPAIVKEIDNRTSLAIALIENIQRQELNPVESARAYQRLMAEFGLNQTELALEVGKSQPTIANSLRLLALPEQILVSVSSGTITEGHAKVLLSVDDTEAKIELWKAIITGALSVRETERRAKTLKTSIPRGIIEIDPSESAEKDIDQQMLEEQLSLFLGSKVRLRFAGRDKGHIEVQFYDLDHLDSLISKLTR